MQKLLLRLLVLFYVGRCRGRCSLCRSGLLLRRFGLLAEVVNNLATIDANNAGKEQVLQRCKADVEEEQVDDALEYNSRGRQGHSNRDGGILVRDKVHGLRAGVSDAAADHKEP